jgi:hypothetical protein
MIRAGCHRLEHPMKKLSIALAAAALVAAALPSSAQARCRGCGAAAVIGGIAAGAIIGSAIANSQPGYAAPAYGVPPADTVDAPDASSYVGGPVCHVENRKIWVEGYGYRTRRMEICE